MYFLSLQCVLHLHPSHSPCFSYHNSSRRKEQIMDFIIMKLLHPTANFLLLRTEQFITVFTKSLKWAILSHFNPVSLFITCALRTNSMAHITSWDYNSHSGSHLVWNTVVHEPSFVSIPATSIQSIFTPHFFKNHFYSILHLHLDLPSDVSFRFSE
jgi:hypothetical protein